MKVQSPREKLLADKASVTRWQQLADNSFFVEMTERALVEFMERLGDANDPGALANHYRLQGARAYRRLLLQFADPAETPRARASDRLEPDAERYVAPPRAKP